MPAAAAAWRQAWQRRFDGWLHRRGPLQPPLTIGYRQVYILPTRFGITFGVLLLAMLFGALNYNNNAALFMSFLLGTAAQVSTFRSWRNLSGLAVQRVHAAPVFAGEPLSVRLQCAEPAGLERPGLELDAGGIEGRDRLVLAPWDTRELVLAVPTRRRGWQTLPRLRLSTTYPLGLFRAWSWVQPAQRCLVYPAPARQAPPLPAAAVSSRQRRRRLDQDTEFAGLREYRHGDNLKAIAWKASARNSQLISRDEPPTSHSEYLFTPRQTGAADTERQVAVMTHWVLLAERRRHVYGLDLPGCRVAPGRGAAHLHDCLRELALWRA
jgi:uncharacterized protein (DUF58 family)